MRDERSLRSLRLCGPAFILARWNLYACSTIVHATLNAEAAETQGPQRSYILHPSSLILTRMLLSRES